MTLRPSIVIKKAEFNIIILYLGYTCGVAIIRCMKITLVAVSLYPTSNLGGKQILTCHVSA